MLLYVQLQVHTDMTMRAFTRSKEQSSSTKQTKPPNSQDSYRFTCKMLSTCAFRLVSKAVSVWFLSVHYTSIDRGKTVVLKTLQLFPLTTSHCITGQPKAYHRTHSLKLPPMQVELMTRQWSYTKPILGTAGLQAQGPTCAMRPVLNISPLKLRLLRV